MSLTPSGTGVRDETAPQNSSSWAHDQACHSAYGAPVRGRFGVAIEAKNRPIAVRSLAPGAGSQMILRPSSF